RGAAHRLPFADGSFDLVAANGIIQWVGLADHSRSVGDLQQGFLKECRRVLKPDGVLFLGVENRYGATQLLGARDHSGLRYTSVIPRKLADITVRHFRRTGGRFSRRFRMDNDWRDYRTHTHSIRGYKTLLKGCGFEDVQSYWAYPSNNQPKIMGRIENGKSLRALLDYSRQTLDIRIRGSAISRSALRLRFLTGHSILSRWFLRLSPDLVFFARPARNPGGESTLDSVVGQYTIRCSGSNKIIWWDVDAPGRSQVVKMARFPNDEKDVEVDENQTARYNHTPITKETHGQWTLFREPLLRARSMDALSEKENLAAISVLLALQAGTHSGLWDARDLAEEIARNLQRFCDLTRDVGLRQLAERDCRTLCDAVAASTVRVVTEHGDYVRNNILWDAEGRAYLIDWSHSREAGEPLFDFSMLSQIHWETWRELSRRTGKPSTAPALKSMIAAFTKATNLKPELAYAYYPYSLLRRILRTGPFYRHTLVKYFRDRRFPQPD
ncbi:MAG: methyltransferase domain-containing protein, partial [Terriglobia bacterium]